MNFVIFDELQDYWLELIERHKLRENILGKHYHDLITYQIRS